MSAQHTPGPTMNLTQYTLSEVAAQWGVRVHLAGYSCGASKVWLASREKAEVTCGRCRAAIAKATGSTS